MSILNILSGKHYDLVRQVEEEAEKKKQEEKDKFDRECKDLFEDLEE